MSILEVLPFLVLFTTAIDSYLIHVCIYIHVYVVCRSKKRANIITPPESTGKSATSMKSKSQ